MSSRLSRLVLNLRRNLPPDASRSSRFERLLRALARPAGWCGASLDLLAALYGTDKVGEHDYTPVYGELFRPWRGKPVRLLEVGVGGYAGAIGGESLRMWASYFRRGRIYGIDLYDKTALSGGRVQVFQCSQVDRPKLTGLAGALGPFDFIIDDGSHLNAHQVESFGILWPFVKDGGWYIVEDVQTSYWPSYGGGMPGTPAYEKSCMRFFTALADSVNEAEFLEKPRFGVEPAIGHIAFHHNMIVLKKDETKRVSNVPLGNEKVRATLLKPLASK